MVRNPWVNRTPMNASAPPSTTEKTNPRLVGIAGPFRGTTFSLREGDVSVGRESSNDLWIAASSLSRRHCMLNGNGEVFSVRDLGSRNGTLVNGMPVQEQLLSHGDQICIGDSVLV